MSAILEEAIEEVRTLPPEKQQHLRELSEDFGEMLSKASGRGFALMVMLFLIFGKNLDDPKLQELRSELEKLISASPQELPSEGTTLAQPRDLAREEQWIDAHRDEYLGEWVVVEGDRLIVHGHDARTVYNAARDAGIEVPFLVRVKPANELPFGGW